MKVKASALLEPLRVGAVLLPNRLVMGSMHTGLEGHPERFDELGRFYAERARGGAGLIVTGGFSPDFAGRLKDDPTSFERPDQVDAHRKIAEAVHAVGGRVILQIVHAGRYGYHPDIVAPSAVRAPINRHTPRAMTEEEIEATIAAYANTAALARAAGYDGVEVMGSEGYLISEFLASRTNLREDDWGGSLANRARFPLAVVRAVRRALGEEGILSYRISALELVEDGLGEKETLCFAKQVEQAGADCLSTGIGWHESTVPTIAGSVPHAGFAAATRRLKSAVTIPVTASNRINLPEDAERLIAEGAADLVSMARPFLADAEIGAKLKAGRPDLITICIACNQACLDHYFTGQVITCLVNPRAVHEADFLDEPAAEPKRVAVVGGGVAGIAAALEAARRSHHVTLYEAAPEIGGQFTLAAKVPGKEDYARAVESFRRQLEEEGVVLRTGEAVTAEELGRENLDAVVIATGVVPRPLDLPGADDPRVVGYSAILDGSVTAGERVVVIGGGGIGHDVALFLAMGEGHDAQSIADFEARWGIGRPAATPVPARQVTMVKRSAGPFGKTLGKSTGWILRSELKALGVRQIAEARYLKIDAEGLHIEVGGAREVLPADTIVVCAGQLSAQGLAEELAARGQAVEVIGGAKLAAELDAKRAIFEGARLGNRL